MRCAPNERVEGRIHARAARYDFSDVARDEPALSRSRARVSPWLELMGRMAHATHALCMFPGKIREQAMRTQRRGIRSGSKSADPLFER